MRACNVPTLKFLLPIACRQRTHGNRTLPPELVDIIVQTALVDGCLGISREEVEIRRRAVMADRKVGSVGANEVGKSALSFHPFTDSGSRTPGVGDGVFAVRALKCIWHSEHGDATYVTSGLLCSSLLKLGTSRSYSR